MARMQRSLFDQLNALAEEISQSPVKTAAEKAAGPVPSDPGGYQGASSHPSVSVGKLLALVPARQSMNLTLKISRARSL